MDDTVKIYQIANGFVAYTWVEGQQVNGRGPSEETAREDLVLNLELHRRLRDRCRQALRSLPPAIPGPGSPVP